MSDDSELIECDEHGKTPCTFVCQHLTWGVACGYHASGENPADKWPDAWCDRCQDAVQKTGGEWNDKSQKVAGIKLLCTHCYEAARARNEHPPLYARGKRARLTKKEAATLLHHATHQMQALQDTTDRKWGFNAMAKWGFDDEERTLTFSDPQLPTIVADVRLVGSYSTKSKTFQWSWQTLDDDAPEVCEVVRLHTFGEVRGISKLTTPNWECDVVDGWEMASLAGYLLGTEALYCAPFKHTRWFMLLSNLRHVN